MMSFCVNGTPYVLQFGVVSEESAVASRSSCHEFLGHHTRADPPSSPQSEEPHSVPARNRPTTSLSQGALLFSIESATTATHYRMNYVVRQLSCSAWERHIDGAMRQNQSRDSH